MYYYFMYNRLTFMEHYHMRSNIESAYSMIKGKFGDSVRSKSDTGQINEALCKVLCHNICCLIQSMYELNLKPKFWSVAAGTKQDHQLETDGLAPLAPAFCMPSGGKEQEALPTRGHNHTLRAVRSQGDMYGSVHKGF
jgi:hypothetical protein